MYEEGYVFEIMRTYFDGTIERIEYTRTNGKWTETYHRRFWWAK